MKKSGFSLIELMATIAIMAILMSVATPSFQNTIERNEITSEVQELGTTLKLARSEAVKHNSFVSVCASSNQSTCTGTWKDGWIIFVDANANGIVDTNEALLKVWQGLASGHTLTWSGPNAGYLTFTNRGFTNDQSGTFKICGSSNKASFARGLIVPTTGSTRFAVDSNANSLYEDNTGTDFSC